LEPSITSYTSTYNPDLIVRPEDELYIFLEGSIIFLYNDYE